MFLPPLSSNGFTPLNSTRWQTFTLPLNIIARVPLKHSVTHKITTSGLLSLLFIVLPGYTCNEKNITEDSRRVETTAVSTECLNLKDTPCPLDNRLRRHANGHTIHFTEEINSKDSSSLQEQEKVEETPEESKK
ncbi:ANK [Lepeophtheirus salmonis]|uniref:ANK n=1 Tax=Lepeophtheirus salmonis TaxID=72036 RepID=A0A7R8H4J1_LEPSM|nr:ANK [Lepeophtheirus salmonis]CAF2861351.1 ANK [Lepeophtheirus salmonis]